MSSPSLISSKTGDDMSVTSSMTITHNSSDNDDRKSVDSDLDDYYNERESFNKGKRFNNNNEKSSDVTNDDNLVKDFGENNGMNNNRNKIELFMPKCGSFDDKNDEFFTHNVEDIDYDDYEFDEENNDDSLNSDDEIDEEKITKKAIKMHAKLAKEHLSDNNGDEAIDEYVRCITLLMGGWRKGVEEVSWVDCVESCNIHLKIARVYHDMKGCPNQALEHCQTSQSIMEATDKKLTNLSFLHSITKSSNKNNSIEEIFEDHRDTEGTFTEYQKYKNSFKHYLFLFNLSFIRAGAYLSLKKFKKSEKLLIKCKKMLSRRQEKSPKNQCQVIQCLKRNVAEFFVKLYEGMSNPESALDHLQQRMDMGGYDEDSEQLASFYYIMGRLQQSRSDDEVSMEKALENYMKSHSIICKRHSENSIQAADSCYKISLKLISAEICDDVAETYLKDSIEIYKRTYGLSDIRTLAVIDEKVKMMMRREEVKEAIELLEETYQHKRMIFPQYSHHISTHLKVLATCYLAQNQPQKALQLFKKCHDIEKVVYPKKHKERMNTVASIRMLQQAYKKDFV